MEMASGQSATITPHLPKSLTQFNISKWAYAKGHFGECSRPQDCISQFTASLMCLTIPRGA